MIPQSFDPHLFAIAVFAMLFIILVKKAIEINSHE